MTRITGFHWTEDQRLVATSDDEESDSGGAQREANLQQAPIRSALGEKRKWGLKENQGILCYPSPNSFKDKHVGKCKTRTRG